MKTDGLRNVAYLLMSTGQPRIHRDIYYGLPIKFWAILMTFVDLIFNIIPVFYTSGRYRVYVMGALFITRIAAFYSVLNPKTRNLYVYKCLLLIEALGCYFICLLQLFLLIIDANRGCEKGYVRHTFAVCGVLVPLEMLCFLTISAYITFLSNPLVDDQTPPQPPTSPMGSENPKFSEATESPNTSVNESADSQRLLPAV